MPRSGGAWKRTCRPPPAGSRRSCWAAAPAAPPARTYFRPPSGRSPAEMIDRNFRVNGKVVEYALILANGKRLPIDSKWPSPELLDRLNDGLQEPGQEVTLVQEIERVLRLKVREVKQYIDPAATLGFALAAVPDPVFNACRRAHLGAYRDGALLG